MIEFIEYKGRKLPFAITMSSLIEFKNASGKEIETSIQADKEFTKLYETILLITIIGLRKGYELSEFSLFTKLKNLFLYRSVMGFKTSDYPKIIDTEFKHILELIPKFYLSLSESDKKK